MLPAMDATRALRKGTLTIFVPMRIKGLIIS